MAKDKDDVKGHDGKKKDMAKAMSMNKKHKMGKGEGKKAMPFGKEASKGKESMGKF